VFGISGIRNLAVIQKSKLKYKKNMADEYYLSVSSPLFPLGKPKKNPKESQENLRRNPRESDRF